MNILPIFTYRYLIAGIIGLVVIQVGLTFFDAIYSALEWFTLGYQFLIVSYISSFLISYFFAYFYERVDIGHYTMSQSAVRYGFYMFLLVAAIRLPSYQSFDTAILHWIDSSFVIGFLPCIVIVPFLHKYVQLSIK